MEDELGTLINQSSPVLPKRPHSIQVREVDTLVAVEVLWWEGLDDLRNLLRQLAVAGKEFQEDEAGTRSGCGNLWTYSTTFRWTTRI